MIEPVIVITHAAFDADRRAACARLEEQLAAEAPGIRRIVVKDHDRSGSLPVWLDAMHLGLESGATHVVSLPDDAIVCKGFGDALLSAIRARPDDVFDCHCDDERAPATVAGSFFSTHDGFNGLGGVIPRDLLKEHLRWRAENLDADVANDLGVNMWAMATGRLIYKTAPSLGDHDGSVPSVDGNDWQGERRALHLAKDGAAIVFHARNDAPHAGRTRAGNHWETIFRSSPSSWNLENMYRVQRQSHKPLDAAPHVFIAIPAYQAPEAAMRASLRSTIDDLAKHGIRYTIFETSGDSLVTRGRHVLVHEFLCSPATHLLQWDADIECEDHTAVRKMVESGHAIIGGAYPFRDGSGQVVANLLEADMVEGKVSIDTRDHTIPVREVGTGFLMVKREVFIDLQQRHPELMYCADLQSHTGVPMWALFDVHLEMMSHGRRRYASEDWRFCQLAREAGYQVRIYYPPKFRHWGKKGHEGHVTQAWGMR